MHEFYHVIFVSPIMPNIQRSAASLNKHLKKLFRKNRYILRKKYLYAWLFKLENQMFKSTVLILKTANVYLLIYTQLYLLLTNRSPNATV